MITRSAASFWVDAAAQAEIVKSAMKIYLIILFLIDIKIIFEGFLDRNFLPVLFLRDEFNSQRAKKRISRQAVVQGRDKSYFGNTAAFVKSHPQAQQASDVAFAGLVGIGRDRFFEYQEAVGVGRSFWRRSFLGRDPG